MLTFHLAQNHGGWNSDDNQNHNLGRFRLSITTAPDAVGRPAARSACARSWPSRRASGRRAQEAAVFSYWRTTVPEWKEANARIEALWQAASRRDRRNWSLLAREQSRATRTCCKRGDFLKPGKPVEPGVPAFLHPLPAGRAADPADVRPLAGRPPVADDGPGAGQPRLAGLFRHRPGRAPARTSARRASRRRIPSCSTGWPSSSWTAAGA